MARPRFRYGLGTCYMRMSKLRLADYHYRKAAQIHPHNAVLLGCVAMVSVDTWTDSSHFYRIATDCAVCNCLGSGAGARRGAGQGAGALRYGGPAVAREPSGAVPPSEDSYHHEEIRG